MLKGIIFDMDGVIVDSHAIHMRAWRRLLSIMGKRVSDADMQFVLDGRKRDDILRHYFGDLPPDKLHEYGCKKEVLFQEEATELRPIAGLFAFLAEIETAGIRKAVATSANQQRAELVLRRLGIYDRVDVIVTGNEVADGKPSPAIFRLAGQRLNLCPQNLLVAEDAGSGVRGAKAAGMKCLAIAADGRAPLLLEAGADIVVSDFLSISLAQLQRLFQA